MAKRFKLILNIFVCAGALATAGAARAEKAECLPGLSAEGSIGVNPRYKPRDSAGPPAPGGHGLAASRPEDERGMAPIGVRTGAASICYILIQAVGAPLKK